MIVLPFGVWVIGVAGKHGPKRGGVNCQGRGLGAERMANIRHGFERRVTLHVLYGTQY